MLKKKYIAAAIILCLLIFGSCIGRNTLNKEQIIQFVHDYEELLNKAIEEIWGLDAHVSIVANTRFRSRPEIDFEGLYTGGVISSEYVIQPLDNPILYELLSDGRIRSIGITRANLHRNTTYQIQFAFNVRGVWDRYGGIYFSKNDEPILFNGSRWANPEVSGDGWARYGRHYYYTERIVANWFYYEMLFNADRAPPR